MEKSFVSGSCLARRGHSAPGKTRLLSDEECAMQRQRRRAVRQEGIRCQKPCRLLSDERRKTRHDDVHEHRHELERLSVRHRSRRSRLYRCLVRSHATFTNAPGAARQRAAHRFPLLRSAWRPCRSSTRHLHHQEDGGDEGSDPGAVHGRGGIVRPRITPLFSSSLKNV